MKTQRTMDFTLIELLVVISIISLLISILLPALSSARERASFVQCASNLRGVGTANLLYAQDHHDLLAPNRSIGQGSYTADLTWRQRFGALLLLEQSYMTAGEILHSPSDKARPYGTYQSGWNLFKSQGYPGNGNDQIRTSYVFREPSSSVSFNQQDPTSSTFFPLYRLGDQPKLAMIADRFTGNYAWSFHNPQGRKDTQSNTGDLNGDGWHVTFDDGHVSFYRNEQGIYIFGTTSGAAGGWNNRHKNWLYWDEN